MTPHGADRSGMAEAPLARHPCAGGRDGVVLMETILVLPVLLMLLGGLFVIGELLMGRLAAHELDRALAWRAAERFTYDKSSMSADKAFNSSAFEYLVGPHGITGMPGLYAAEMEGSEMRNEWSSVFAGRSDVQVNVPWWVAFVNTQDAVMGDPRNPNRMDEKFKLNSGDDGKFTQTARTYVFRRNVNAGERSGHTRDFKWVEAAGDTLAGAPLNIPAQGGLRGEFNRSQASIYVSGDPGQ